MTTVVLFMCLLSNISFINFINFLYFSLMCALVLACTSVTAETFSLRYSAGITGKQLTFRQVVPTTAEFRKLC